MTAAVHRRISKRDLLAALRHAGMPLDTHRNRAYFIGIDSRGREFAIILAADDRDDDLWHAIHALQTATGRTGENEQPQDRPCRDPLR
ncbi:hypothetical protein [Mycobacterium sp.]|uniref:hypothetical protein n=1 Tax=Mycobacterium sp. TaxID=1785 RepID=UPI002C916A64|nr:hypothetical protein [Mycobacterium sp.]HTH89466.1 hypothetical protein [Mycobacterium sp.]